MSRRSRWSLAAVAALGFATSGAASTNVALTHLEYVSPLPGSDRILPETNIIVRPGGIVDPASVGGASPLSATGSVSGFHSGRLRLSDDGATLTFGPDARFTPGEIVTCRLASGVRTHARGDIAPAEFSFSIAGPERESLRGFALPPDEEDPERPAPVAGASTAPGGSVPRAAALAAEPLPPDFPGLSVTGSGTPSTGRMFLCDIRLGEPARPSHLMILENDGTPYFFRKLAGSGLDFKLQPDGRLTYFDRLAGAFYAMDSTYAVVDSFRSGNGYATDTHELILLPDGHALLMAYDPQFVDMSQIVPGGHPFATVVGLVIQELDREKRVVFQWRSWDHFQITDATHISMKRLLIDYVHGNSIDVDTDGGLILSCRHMDEVTKISRSTGEIVWRFGGTNNQFAIERDPIGFSRQHDARRLPNGNLTLFDNGNFHDPAFSRAVEYALDEEARTATLVWEYRHNPDVFGVALGSVQRLPNGSTLIGWGSTAPALTEVAPNGRVALEVSLDPGIVSYRAFRFLWPRGRWARVTFNPATVSASAQGPWIQAVIEPIDFDASDIDVASVRLAGSIPAEPAGASLGDGDRNGAADLTVRFGGESLGAIVEAGTNWLEVTGSLVTGEPFRGTASLSVVAAGAPGRAPSLRLVSPAGAVPIVLGISARPRGALDSARPGRDRDGWRLAVYDVQGRAVARRRADLNPGAGGRVSWDGRGPTGARASSGIYFARLEWDGREASAGAIGGGAARRTPGPAVKFTLLR